MSYECIAERMVKCDGESVETTRLFVTVPELGVTYAPNISNNYTEE